MNQGGCNTTETVMRVVVGQDESESTEVIRRALLGLGLECGAADCVPLRDLGVRLAQAPTDLVLVQTGARADEALEAIRQALALTRSPILAVGPTSDARHILRTQECGARAYLDENRLEGELTAQLQRLGAAGEVKYAQGQTVGVVSATPGSGVTTVATNLAFAWAEHHPRQVALIELGREPADLALNLDLDPEHTITEAAANWQRMDAELLRRSMTAHPGGVQVLAHRPETLTVDRLEPQAVRKAVLLMRTLFTTSVLDLGHLLGDEHFEALRLCDHILIVVRLDIPALRQTRRLLALLGERAIPRERIQLLANRYGQSGQLPWKQAEEAVGAKFLEFIPDDSGRLNQALMQGQPLVRQSPSARIARTFTKLAATLNVSS